MHIPYSIAEPFYRFAQLVICSCWTKKNWSNEPSVAPATLHGECIAQPYAFGSVGLGELTPGLRLSRLIKTTSIALISRVLG